MNDDGIRTVVPIKKIKTEKKGFYFLAKTGDHHEVKKGE
jgi:hypothetical protein